MSGAMDYYRPASLPEALAVLARFGGEARPLAGGQDLVPLMNQGRLAPAAIVDLKHLRDLAVIAGGDTLRIGALVTHREIATSESVLTMCPLLAEAAGHIGGGPQVRNRGTIGGSVSARNPAYDYAACLLAVDAEFRIAGQRGERRVAASVFLREAPASEPASAELLVEVVVPVTDPAAGWAYEKLKFTDGCYTIAGAAAMVTLDARGMCMAVRFAVCGVEPVPARMRDIEDRLVGVRLTEAVLADTAAAVEGQIAQPLTDALADGDYRRAMAGVVARRALERAARRARPSHRGSGSP
jgi:CO/xanthine dehydrogenase FAD-binding subunit